MFRIRSIFSVDITFDLTFKFTESTHLALKIEPLTKYINKIQFNQLFLPFLSPSHPKNWTWFWNLGYPVELTEDFFQLLLSQTVCTLEYNQSISSDAIKKKERLKISASQEKREISFLYEWNRFFFIASTDNVIG